MSRARVRTATPTRPTTPPFIGFWGHRAVLPFLLTAIAFLVYSTSLNGKFVFDDQSVIFQNQQLMFLKSFSEIFSFGDWRQPLYVTYGLNAYLGGTDPFGYHVTSVLLHALNTIIIFFILTEMGAERWPAVAGSAIFVVHPIFTGAVSYLAGRSSVLCGTFYFLAILAFLRGLRSPSRVKAGLNWALAGLVAWLAWSTKQEAIALPLFLGAYLWIRTGSKNWKILALLAAVPIAAVVLFRNELARLSISVSENAALVAAGFDPALSPLVYFRTYIAALTGYILPRFVLPVRLNVDPDIQVVQAWYSLEFLFSVAVLLGLGALVLYFRHREKLLLRTGIAAVLVSPLAAYAVMPLADVVMEHRIYIAGLGVALLGAWLGDWSYRRFSNAGIVACAVLIGVLGFVTLERNRVWANSTTLWEDAVRKSPQKARPHMNLGVAYQDTNRFPEAMREYETAFQLKPDLNLALANMGVLYFKMGDNERARQVLERARQSGPSFPQGWWNLGMVYIAMKQPDKAIEVLNDALKITPSLHIARFARGDAFALKAQYAEAIEDYEHALELQPTMTAFQLRLGTLYSRKGDRGAAEQTFLGLTADTTVGADANRNLGVMRSEAGDYDGAIVYLQNALRQRPIYPDVHHDLAVVYLRKGMMVQAIQEARTTLAQNPGFEAAFLTLSEAYEKSGQPQAAKQVLTEYLQRIISGDSTYAQQARLRLQTIQ